MGKNIKDIESGFSKERQNKISARVKELIAEEMTMRELRKAMDLTQMEMAKIMNKNQDEISRIESRSDILLSTLQKFVSALGGELSLVAEFPDQNRIVLAGFRDINNDEVLEKKNNHAAKVASDGRTIVKRRALVGHKVTRKKVKA